MLFVSERDAPQRAKRLRTSRPAGIEVRGGESDHLTMVPVCRPDHERFGSRPQHPISGATVTGPAIIIVGAIVRRSVVPKEVSDDRHIDRSRVAVPVAGICRAGGAVVARPFAV